MVSDYILTRFVGPIVSSIPILKICTYCYLWWCMH